MSRIHLYHIVHDQQITIVADDKRYDGWTEPTTFGADADLLAEYLAAVAMTNDYYPDVAAMLVGGGVVFEQRNPSHRDYRDILVVKAPCGEHGALTAARDEWEGVEPWPTEKDEEEQAVIDYVHHWADEIEDALAYALTGECQARGFSLRDVATSYGDVATILEVLVHVELGPNDYGMSLADAIALRTPS